VTCTFLLGGTHPCRDPRRRVPRGREGRRRMRVL